MSKISATNFRIFVSNVIKCILCLLSIQMRSTRHVFAYKYANTFKFEPYGYYIVIVFIKIKPGSQIFKNIKSSLLQDNNTQWNNL